METQDNQINQNLVTDRGINNLDAMEPINSVVTKGVIVDVRDLGPLSTHERNRLLAIGE